MAWGFWQDASLTDAYSELSCTATSNTFKIYFGNAVSGIQLIHTTTGSDILLSIADSATGGHAASAVKLATTSGGLSTASGGAALNLGAAILGGTANAEEIWCQVVDAVKDGTKSTELSLSLSSCLQTVT